MKRDDFTFTSAASGTTLNDGAAILAAVREQHRWQVEPRHGRWSAAREIARKKRLTRST